MAQAASIQPGNARGGSTRSLDVQRWGALIGGAALALYGLSRRSPLGMAIAAGGGALALAGARPNARREPIARSSVQVNCSPEKAYQFWRNFENLPRFMHHLESVRVTGDNRSEWVAIGPMNSRVKWNAEIVNERDNELIVWRSLPGSEVSVEGSVEFRRASGDRGTVMDVMTTYRPPAGAVGRAVAKMFGKDPSFLMRQDLRRFKALIETGEIPTVEGQTHGPRDVMTAAARMVDPDRPLPRGASMTEVAAARRRAS